MAFRVRVKPREIKLRTGRRRRPVVRLLMIGLLGAMVALGLFIYEALLPEALAPRVVEVLQTRLGPGHTVTVGSTHLATSSGSVELVVEDLTVTGTDGKEVAFAPRAQVRLDSGALMGGQIAVSSLRLDTPRIVLRVPDPALPPGGPGPGAVVVPAPSAAPPSGGEAISEADRNLLTHLVGTLDDLTSANGAAAALDEIVVSSGSISVERGDGTPAEKLDRVSLRLVRNPITNGFAATIDSEATTGAWSATLTSSPPTPDGRVFDLGIKNVKLSLFKRLAGWGMADADATIGGHLNLTLESDMTVSAGEIRLDVQDMSALVPDATRPVMAHIDEVLLRGRWDGAQRAFRLDPSRIADEGGEATFTGELRLPPQNSSDPWKATLEGADILLPGEPGERPLRLNQISVSAAYQPAARTLDIGVAQIVGPSVKIALSGAVAFGDTSPAITMGIAATALPVIAVKRLWPKVLLGNIREWMGSNVQAGTLDGFLIAVDIKPGDLARLKPFENLPDGALTIESSFTDGVISPLPDMPVLLGMAGKFKITGRTAHVQVSEARVDTSTGSVVLSGDYSMADTSPRYPEAHVALTVAGSANSMAELFVQGKLGPNPMPPIIKAESIRGALKGSADARFTIGPPGEVPAAQVAVDAELKDISIDNVAAGKPLEQGNFRVTRQDGTVTLKGEGRIGGAPAKIDIVDEGSGKRQELLASLTLDGAARTKLGLVGLAGLKGSVEVKLKTTLVEGPVEVQVDLGPTTIDGLLPGFKKRSGAPGTLKLTVVRGTDRTSLKDLVLESGSVLVKGNAELDAAGELSSASLAPYRLVAGDDVRVTVDRSKSLLKLVVAGRSFDLRPLMSDLFSGKAGEESSVDLDIDLSLDAGIGYNGETVSGLRMDMARRGGRLRELGLKADRIGNGRLSVVPSGQSGTFLAAGEDAGSFFRFLDIYAKAIGGKFTLQFSSGASMQGVLEVSNFQVKGEKALAAVAGSTAMRLDTSRATSASRTAEVQAVQFTKLRMGFNKAGGRMALSDVVLWGPQIGLSLEGTLDFNADLVNVVGTFVPAYALNNLFSKLPVIGFFLGGGGGGSDGLVGVTFRITGALSKPILTINPMSAVAPGFLRKLFEFRQRENAGKAGAEVSPDKFPPPTPPDLSSR